jgi:hypothetical protein
MNLNNEQTIVKDELFKTNKKLDSEIENINILKTKLSEKNKEFSNLKIIVQPSKRRCFKSRITIKLY